MSVAANKKARFDTRLSQEQKDIFERAAYLDGYRNLTDFIIHTVQAEAKKIIHKKEQTIASQRDGEVFFKAITNPPKPSKTLKRALDDYNHFTDSTN